MRRGASAPPCPIAPWTTTSSTCDERSNPIRRSPATSSAFADSATVSTRDAYGLLTRSAFDCHVDRLWCDLEDDTMRVRQVIGAATLAVTLVVTLSAQSTAP